MVIYNHGGLYPLAPHNHSPIYIYAPLVFSKLNIHLDRYVMFQTFRKLHPAKNSFYILPGKITLLHCRQGHRTPHSLIPHRTIGLAEHRYPCNTFGISNLRYTKTFGRWNLRGMVHSKYRPSDYRTFGSSVLL